MPYTNNTSQPTSCSIAWSDYYTTLSNLPSRDVNIKAILHKVFPRHWAPTALHMAAYYNVVSVVRELLRLGADTQEKNNYGETVLESALSGKAESVVKFLTHYKNTSTKTKRSNIPLLPLPLYHKSTPLKYTPHAIERSRERNIEIDWSLTLDEIIRFPIYSIDKGCTKYLDTNNNILYYLRGHYIVTMVSTTPLQTLRYYKNCIKH